MSVFFKKCPSCGKRFGVKLTARESESRDIEMGEEVVLKGYRASPKRVETHDMATGEDVAEETFHCNKCGHTWTEQSTKEWRGQLPKGEDWAD
jgi:predicted RNA-binding Zn-ribbon protein involved in translation (DUF1610 family)